VVRRIVASYRTSSGASVVDGRVELVLLVSAGATVVVVVVVVVSGEVGNGIDSGPSLGVQEAMINTTIIETPTRTTPP
jgi:hypothetical protein